MEKGKVVVKKNQVGWHDEDRGLYLFTPESFQRICDKVSYKLVLGDIRRRGHLMQNDKSRLLTRYTISDTERPRLCAIKDSILFDKSLGN